MSNYITAPYNQTYLINSQNSNIGSVNFTEIYYGNWGISGDFTVIGNNVINGDSTIMGNLTIHGTSNLLNVDIQNITSTSITTDGNAIINGNLYSKKYIILDEEKDTFIYGLNGNIGINKNNPEATLDIYGNGSTTLNVFSKNSNSKNVLVQNNRNQGITMKTTQTFSEIGFYTDTTNTNLLNISSVPDARISYNGSGNIEILSNNNVFIRPNLVVRNTNNLPLTTFNESVLIYDNSNNQSLTLSTQNPNSNTFLNMVSRSVGGNVGGMNICGGLYKKDVSRSMGSFGWTTRQGEYIPSQMIVAGNSNVKMRSTIGINTFTPKTEKYVLNVNGPVLIENGDLAITYKFSQQSISAISKSSKPMQTIYFIANTFPVDSQTNAGARMYKSTDGGQMWDAVNFTTNTMERFTSLYTYDNSFSIVSFKQNNNFYFYRILENNQVLLNIYPSKPTKIYNMFIDNTYIYILYQATINNEIAVYIIYTSYSYNANDTSLNSLQNYRIRLSADEINNFSADENNHKYSMTGFTDNDGNNVLLLSYMDQISYFRLQPSPSLSNRGYNNKEYSQLTNVFYNNIYAKNKTAIAVGKNIITYFVCKTGFNNNDFVDVSNNNILINNNHIAEFNLNSVFIYDDKSAIAVGDNGLIIYSDDGFVNWKNIPSNIINSAGNQEILNDTLNNYTNITMPDKNTFLITVDISGNGNTQLIYCYLPNLFNHQNNIVFTTYGNVLICGGESINKDLYVGGNTMIDGNVESTSPTTGSAVIRCGVGIGANVYVGGNLVVGNATNIYSKIESTSPVKGALVITGGVGIGANVYVGGNLVVGNATNIYSKIESTSPVKGALVITGGVGIGANVYVGGNLVVGNATNIYSTIESTSPVKGALVITGGVGIGANVYIGGNLVVGNATNIYSTIESTSPVKGALVITGGVGIGANVYVGGNLVVGNATNIYSTIESTSPVKGALVITGGVGIGANVYIGGNLVVGNATNIYSTIESTSTTKGALVIAGGVGIGANVYVGGNLVVGNATNIYSTIEATSPVKGALVITGGVGIGANVYVGGNLVVGNATNIYSTIESTSTTKGALVITGGVGIGANVYVGGNLDIAMDATASSYNARSDYRIKSNISPITKETNIDLLNPVHYFNLITNKKDFGFIAHEVQEHFPFLVNGNKDGKEYQSINYNGFIGLLVSEIKEMKKEINTLRVKIDEITRTMKDQTV